MGRFLVLWRMNPNAPTPTDLSEVLKLNEMMFAAMVGLIASGEIEEFGWFPDGLSGYTITKGEATDNFRNASMFLPYVHCEVHEIIPYEKGKEISIAVLKAQIAAVQK